MNKFKTQKGITLVALIITVIVLLILAVVTIKEIQSGSIVEYAKKASGDYKQKQDEEDTILGKYEAELDKAYDNVGQEHSGHDLRSMGAWEQKWDGTHIASYECRDCDGMPVRLVENCTLINERYDSLATGYHLKIWDCEQCGENAKSVTEKCTIGTCACGYVTPIS